jgi:hypothetical protein
MTVVKGGNKSISNFGGFTESFVWNDGLFQWNASLNFTDWIHWITPETEEMILVKPLRLNVRKHYHSYK